ncbi:hypothetical protein POTOM_053505 [Populus tomentosa]|uniref:Costars domain-containing protein n=1 Tax=Populus tomentosa TaxID=118781 RepID=A0A8X8C7M2_POPTO|nr:hypothetical protein POTOM_053505 [Populus tomentosa]
MNVEEEVERLKEEIQRLGKVQPDGSYKVNLRVKQLQTSQYICLSSYSSVHTHIRSTGTYEGELLLQGVHDNVEIIIKPAPLPASGAATASVVRNLTYVG